MSMRKSVVAVTIGSVPRAFAFAAHRHLAGGIKPIAAPGMSDVFPYS